MTDLSRDLTNQITRLIAVANALMERNARSFEELDGVRLSLEEIREILVDFFDEAGRKDDRIAERLERLERLLLLKQTQTNLEEARQIEKSITLDLRRDSMQRELIQQIKNLQRANERAARYGINIPTDLANEIEVYQERIDILRGELNGT